MPSRILREGILDSESVCSLTFPAEVFYRRLMSVVDDFGRFDGRVSVLRSRLYPLQIEKVREADISRWIAECEKAGLIVLYVVDGKQYVLFNKTDTPRAASSKYPPPPSGVSGKPPTSSGDGCTQTQTSVNSCAQTHASVPYSDSYSDASSYSDKDTPIVPSSLFAKFWTAYPRKTAKANAEKAFAKISPSAELFAAMIAAINRQKLSDQWHRDGGAFIPHPATWLNGRRWEDEVSAAKPGGKQTAKTKGEQLDDYIFDQLNGLED